MPAPLNYFTIVNSIRFSELHNLVNKSCLTGLFIKSRLEYITFCTFDILISLYNIIFFFIILFYTKKNMCFLYKYLLKRLGIKVWFNSLKQNKTWLESIIRNEAVIKCRPYFWWIPWLIWKWGIKIILRCNKNLYSDTFDQGFDVNIFNDSGEGQPSMKDGWIKFWLG